MATAWHVGIVGAGAWGTALACAARRAGSDVTIWAHETDTVSAINDTHRNPVFLPAVTLDAGIGATGDMAEFSGCDPVLLAAPSAHLRTVSGALAPHVAPGAAVCVCTKGIELGSGMLMTDVAAEALSRDHVAGLSGPSFAAEVALGLPTAVTVAGPEADIDTMAAALGGPMFRVYRSTDVVGIEVGGAVKNVIAIACGIADGRGMGHNARAAVISRGLSEIARLGAALGAERETLMGLAGLGDLVLTCTGTLSRNQTFGRGLGEGRTVAELMEGRNSVVEGAATAPAVVALAARLGVDMPICAAVDDILAERCDVAAAIERLLARPSDTEFT
ncbi:MAG: NAD(P)-dependent glycerol-3-phosphate dehydrogenase [Rhodospirillales bacterium]|nr:NAD(P)-dependent glycerol-3-phosphate dehydrogenase [Rhodospirillales bacterium]